MSVHLQFDISDMSQPFRQRSSELATEGRPGIRELKQTDAAARVGNS